MTIEAKKLAIIERVLSIEEEGVLDALADFVDQTSIGSNFVREGEANYTISHNTLATNSREDFLTEKLDFQDALVEMRENVTFDQLLGEQNYQPITFEEVQKIASEIEWEHSLEELLAAID